jgi:hypothetical protein
MVVLESVIFDHFQDFLKDAHQGCFAHSRHFGTSTKRVVKGTLDKRRMPRWIRNAIISIDEGLRASGRRVIEWQHDDEDELVWNNNRFTENRGFRWYL